MGKNRSAKIIGIILGALISGLLLFYLPMKSNYDECGKVTLCNTSSEHVTKSGEMQHDADS